MKIIVCLGNYGEKYTDTRHNVGFLFGDYLIDTYHFEKKGKKFKGLLYKGVINTTDVYLIKPHTYMNLSGESVQLITAFYKVPLTDVCVVYDDIDIPFTTSRYRVKGSAGTHNGMKSIIQCLGRNDFHRLRIGIGPVQENRELADFVLSPFSRNEKAHLNDIFKKSETLMQNEFFN
jgi:PTH1 family peptidyl-tRNA hydrolase